MIDIFIYFFSFLLACLKKIPGFTLEICFILLLWFFAGKIKFRSDVITSCFYSPFQKISAAISIRRGRFRVPSYRLHFLITYLFCDMIILCCRNALT